MKQLRVVVVDDSSVFRAVVAESVNGSGMARVVAHAANGQEAITKIDSCTPDVVTLDLEMPGRGGLDVLRVIRERHPSTAVLVLSAFTRKGATESMRALELGAYDVLAKPDGPDPEKNRADLRAGLAAFLKGLSRGASQAIPVAPPPAPAPSLRAAAPQIVGIGSSTGGPAALAKILPGLPATLPVPVVVAQHMPPVFTASLAESLAEKCAVRVVEARHGEPLSAGTVYIAPGGHHLRVASAGGAERHLELTDDPPENFCRPAVDYLFRSIAAVYREAAMAAILTGMGKDGTLGLRVMRRYPVYVIGQSEESCTVYGMPREARAAGLVDEELPAERIADAIVARVLTRARA